MTLYEKIIQIYPSIKSEDFKPLTGTILLQNDSDGKGDYIAKWEHSEYLKPTEEQLDAIERKM
jgi:hypothetical protein